MKTSRTLYFCFGLAVLTGSFLLLFMNSAMAQKEALVPLRYHPRVNAKSNAAFVREKAHRRATSLSLPFFDDFYQSAIYPDPNLWQDDAVFINSTYPRYAVTVGVATFDGTDSVGRPYSNVVGASGPADRLTSNPIDLSGLSSDSSVYLSFYYLSGEYGEAPTAPNDSLGVLFLDTSGNWNVKWAVVADTVSTLRQVFIKVDSQYLNANFQFRFQSFGNLNGANDTWHIDYVKLDKNRDTTAEQTIKEMAYEFMPPSLLKAYYVMPYYQFDSTDLADTVAVTVRNNFINTTTDIVDFYDASVVNTGDHIASFNGPSRDFGPLTENVIKYPKFNIPDTLSGDTIIIKVDYHFDVSAEAGLSPRVLANNSVTHQQVFSNFYAYDDGVPERGYWVEGLTDYKMAVKYGLRKPDTLQAIKLQFFPVQADNNLATFSICVWKNFSRNTIYDTTSLIYQQTGLKIEDLVREFGVDTLNGYFYAPIHPEFLKSGYSYPLVLSDTFAIGLIVQDQESLTVGFDRNNNRSAYNFYVDGLTKWRQSDIPGTMIINPVMGKALPGYLTPVVQQHNMGYELHLYPNPARQTLYVDGIRGKSLLEFYTLQGNLILQEVVNASGYVDISRLPAAAYLLRVTDTQSKQTGTSKFIKVE